MDLYLPNSEQLELRLYEEFAGGVEPWGGRSPRVLTRCSERLFLRRKAEKSVSDLFLDERQYDLWLPNKKAPRESSRGAPSLLPLAEEV